jgi:hypothetical protein
MATAAEKKVPVSAFDPDTFIQYEKLASTIEVCCTIDRA